MKRVDRNAVVGTVSCLPRRQIDPLAPVEHCVYFIQHDDGGAIKIGFSSDPKRRMAELQVSLPGRLKLLLTLPGGGELEARLHAHFAEDHIRGEWFRPSDALLGFIAEPHLAEVKPRLSVVRSLYARAGGVTRRQLIVFAAIARAIQRGVPASSRELRETLHMREGAVRADVEALRSKGLITSSPNLSRATALAERGRAIAVRADTVFAGMMRCACGSEYPVFGACPFCLPKEGA